MQEFTGRTAVVTGGASGIGLATVERLAAAGMNIVIGDIEERVLDEQVARLTGEGVDVLGVVTDVADQEAVTALAAAANERFGDVHVLFNNAGVGGGGPMLEAGLDVWEWTLGVNLYGVVHGIRAFGSAMVAHGDPCAIVNTASMAGLLPTPMLGAYTVSKYAVVAMSETLSLETQGTNLSVHVLCPGFVSTNIADSDRNMPEHMAEPLADRPDADLMRAAMRDLVAGGIPPADVAERIFEALQSGRFTILPHPQFGPQIAARGERLVAGDLPVSWDI
ncbi:MAG: SDR family NAD(P)-dependent oxidoreductase [Acidimicrobiales bacterium]|jgi:NAD(P)-dependent dehydrogenase (short-subunit alcohol dehydrogenase family)|nr:SDR family NAD(P)-dependent oxidoreductase [Acidimicrobiales bacterium]